MEDTDFPKQILNKDKRKEKLNTLIIDLSKNNFFKKTGIAIQFNWYLWDNLVKFLIWYSKKNNCKKVLFAGKIEKPKVFKSLRLI